MFKSNFLKVEEIEETKEFYQILVIKIKSFLS
jgi:hypothetical protein